MKKLSAICTCVAVALLSQPVVADERTLQQTEQLSIAANALSTLVIEAGAGSMEVKTADVDDIQVTAKIYQEQPHENYCLELVRKQGKALLRSASCRGVSVQSQHTSIDLTIILPSSLALDITDGSGFIKIDGAAKASIVDGSGYIDIRNVAGSVEIQDGSGLITVRDIHSDLDITDGSGAIEVASVDGDVVISDGSGAIDVASVEGGVTISDGSGSISVNQANRFELLSDGSGQVDVNNITTEVVMNGHGK